MALTGVATSASPVVAATVTDPAVTSPQLSSAEVSASTSAAKAGSPVEVSAETTATTRLFANPNGSFTLQAASRPVRMKQGSAWASLDATLARRSDGSWAPRAAAGSVVFSGGGSGPAVQYTLASGVSLAYQLGVALATPTVSGDTATYPEVFPGVDLRLVALTDGFSEVLVVKTPAAAQQAAVKAPSWTVTVSGGSVSADGHGGFTVSDTSGTVVLDSPPALMWDSAGSSVFTPGKTKGSRTAAPASPARAGGTGEQWRSPVEGDRVAQVGVRVSGATVSLTPVASWFTDSRTVYPVYVDPSVLSKATIIARAMVDQRYPTTSYYNWSGTDQGMGYQNYSGWDLKRLVWAFDTTAVANNQVLSATFSATEDYASSCSAKPVEAWRTSGFGSGVTWNTQWGWAAKMDTKTVSYGRAGCGTSTNVSPNAKVVEFNVTAGVQTFATAGGHSAMFGLKASNESDPLGWKRFQPTALLSVTYDHKPNIPASLNGPGGGCATTQAAAKLVAPGAMSFQANLTDADAGDQPTATFNVYKGGALVASHAVGPQAQGTFTWSNASFTAGGGYYWTVRSWDGYFYAPGDGGPCYFNILTTPPLPPTVTPPAGLNPAAAPVGTGMAFTFAQTGSTAVSSFRWAVNSDTPGPSVTASGGQGTATVQLSSSGPSMLRVWAYDAAGNASTAPAEFPMTAPIATPVRWSMDNHASGSTLDVVRSTPLVTGFVSATSAALTATAGDLLVAVASADTPQGVGASFTWTDTMGGSWTESAHSDTTHTANSIDISGAAVVATRPVTTTGPVSVTLATSSSHNVALTVYEVTGQAASPVGAVATLASTTQDAGAALTTTADGSLIFAAADDWSETGAPASLDLNAQTFDIPGMISGLSGYRSAALAGPQSVNILAAGDAPQWQVALVEIRPGTGGGTLTTESPDAHCSATGASNLTVTGTATAQPGLANAAMGGGGYSSDLAMHVAGAGMAATSSTVPVVTAATAENPNYTLMSWTHIPADTTVVNTAGQDTGKNPLLVGADKVLLSMDAATGSAVTVGLTKDPNGVAQFVATLTGTDGTTVSVTDGDDGVWPDEWFNIAVTVLPGQRTLQLAVEPAAGFNPADAPTVKTTTWTPTFSPAANTGVLRTGSAKPTPGAPTTPVNPWTGDIDEVLAFRAPLLTGNTAFDLGSWIHSNPTIFAGAAGLSPCP